MLPVAAFQSQLAAGFGALRFDERVENAYRQHHLAVSLLRLRPALIILMLFGAFLVAVNLWWVDAASTGPGLLGIAGAGELAILCLFLAGYSAVVRRHLQALGVAVAATLGIASIVIASGLDGTARDAVFAGQLVIVICVYLILGLRFWVALSTGIALTGPFVLFAGLSDVLPATVAHHAIYLVFANVGGAIGLYNLERSRRRDYLEQQVLEHLASRDALTGLYNRQYMDDGFAHCWSRALDAREAIGVAIIDIDHFKRFNDEYGHQRGDECLRAVAARLEEIVREDGWRVYRYGGEEFVVLLDGISRDAVAEFGDLVCRRIESLGIMHSASTTAPVVTASVGIAYTLPHSSRRDYAAFLQLADRALYAAKEAGRNRSVLAIGSDEHTVTGIFTSGQLTAGELP